MKFLAILFIALLSTKGCSDDAKKLAETQVQYTATTRGSYQQININKQVFTIQNTRNTQPTQVTLTADEWKTLANELNKLDLAKINTYPAPSQKSHYDAAMAANLTIIQNGQTYTSNTFDHGNPPAEIKPLVTKLLELSKKNTPE